MSEDRSLEEFAAAGDADDECGIGADADDEGGTDVDGDPSGGVAADAVDPAAPTYDVSPDGAACATCGESVTRRWRDDGDYVCADCKEW